jgi:predicted DNA-binding protein (MmcQ/YjbR family)
MNSEYRKELAEKLNCREQDIEWGPEYTGIKICGRTYKITQVIQEDKKMTIHLLGVEGKFKLPEHLDE